MDPIDRDEPLERGLSRRGFLERSTFAAGAVTAACVLARHADGADRGTSAGDDRPRHPLDPLSSREIAEAVRIVRTAKSVGPSCRFITVALAEPSRSALRADRPDQPIPCAAAVLVMDTGSGRSHEGVVDLGAGTVRSWDAVSPELQPSVTVDEFAECEVAVKRSPAFLAALRKRGIDDPALVMVDAWSAGTYGDEKPEERGRRLVRALAFVRSEAPDNGYARPLDGVIAVLDLHTMEVLRVDDHGVVPLPPESGNWSGTYLPAPRKNLRPLKIEQADGPSFAVAGHEVSWQKWRFRIGFTPREGLVLHDVRYRDGDRERPVLQRAAVSEMVVPYGDPAEKYFRKNAFDIGEYGIGAMANPLAQGCDCLGTVRYFDAHLADSRGRPVTIRNAVCLHEEDAGILWKHTDWRNGQSEVRRSRRLSASFFAAVGNYDYGFYWHFYQDGSIQFEVKLTGIMNTTALAPGETSGFGVEVAPRLNAPYHQHIFAIRLDPAVDGPANAVYEVNMASPPRGPGNPHGNAFRAEATLLAREARACRRVNTATSRFWRVVNHERKNHLGQPVGYRLIPGENAPPLVQPDAAVMKRAGFAANHLWVTAYDPKQRYAAGDYPNQHPSGDGLPAWSAADRPLADTELVLWYVCAHTHVPRLEDWPVMPVGALGFWFRPDGFFDRNPALDVPAPSV
jgi:primary-amine oxidase